MRNPWTSCVSDAMLHLFNMAIPFHCPSIEMVILQHESSPASHLWMARLGKLGSKKPRGASISTTCLVLSHVRYKCIYQELHVTPEFPLDFSIKISLIFLSRKDAPAGRETLPSADELGELEGNFHLCCAKIRWGEGGGCFWVFHRFCDHLDLVQR